ncbi:MAG: APC family permease [Acidobacteria bacterium]|nr:APC family permease [Acidobacteriota bacterium]
MPEPAQPTAAAAKVVVATTVALSFISFWRGAAIVLSDLASTMYYVGGITEQAIGKSAPWFVLAVMLFSFAVRSIYMESCSMFVRGGVYVVVRDSIGPNMAKLSVSALVVDYVLTGPISSVSAGQYLGHLVNEISELLHQPLHINPNHFAVFFSVAVTAWFWRSNIKGIHESSGHALRIMQVTTVMVVSMTLWCLVTIAVRGGVALPPLPTPDTLQLHGESLGWLDGTWFAHLPAVMMVVAFGHSLLAMSGFETLAQVYREIASPKLKNLRITANIVCVYATLSTGLLSMFAVMIIPDSIRPTFKDNLLGGLSMSLAGPEILKLGFHIFVVVIGVLILSGAVNTSLIGANGVLNRVAEDGVLLKWFRKPHARFGTTSRIVNLITLAQILTILGSMGDVYLLGEAYAFGVVWSFFLKGMGVLALRFQRDDQEYKTPFNFRLGGREWPAGLAVTVLMLFLVAIANLFTKKIATVYGVSFTIVLFVIFLISERVNSRQAKSEEKKGLEQFNLDHRPHVDTAQLKARPGCVLVAVRDYNNMEHLRRVLEKTNLRRHDVVVMTAHPMSAGAGEFELRDEQLFGAYEQELFSRVVALAEREGKPVELLVLPATDPLQAMVQAAATMKASRIVTGVSLRMASEELARRIGLAWERLPEPRHAFSLEIISPDRASSFINLGPHPPRLWPEDVDRVHDIWLEVTEAAGLGAKLHHRDVIGVALRRMESELQRPEKREEILESLRDEMKRG